LLNYTNSSAEIPSQVGELKLNKLSEIQWSNVWILLMYFHTRYYYLLVNSKTFKMQRDAIEIFATHTKMCYSRNRIELSSHII
jgi:hypothetical protein